jgi:GNAT superfamily N-acetyltransferase
MIEFQPATPDQAADVLSLLDEAAAWLRARGISQWPERFEPVWVRGAISRGETWLVRVDGTVSGTVTLDWSDRVWADVGGDAAYLHRMAVRRTAAGLGAVILGWAEGVAREHGRPALRLDCVASNTRLRAYYEAAGFVHRGDVTVAGAPGQRLDAGPTVLVSRYELQLAVP